MKIGSKIALFYTLVTLGAFVAMIGIFYFFTNRYINNLYESYLIEKAYLTAQKHYEEDEVDEHSYKIIQQKYNELLPQADEILLNIEQAQITQDTLNKYMTPAQQNKLYREIPITFHYGKMRGAALYYPDNEGNFIVIVMAQNSYGENIQKHILLSGVFLLLISCLLIYLFGRLYADRILRPLQHLLKELKHIRGNNLKVRLKNTESSKDELEDLIQTLNDMLDRIDHTLQSEKSFISNASHELNNPITAIQGECEITLLKERSPEEYIESLQRIATESKRMSQLIKQLLFISRQERELLESSREEINLPEFTQEVCATYPRVSFSNHDLNRKSIIVANNHLLEVAIRNIIDNALKYSDEHVTVCVGESENLPFIEVADKGIGIPKEDISQIFHSFYRAANTRSISGQGIGLSLSMKIIAMYGGKIEVDSELNEYTRVRIVFTKKK